VRVLGNLPGPVLVGAGLVLGSQAGMLSIAMTVHGGWVALTIRVTGLVAFSVGSVVLIRRGMRGADRSCSFQFGLGIGGAVGAVLYWLLVPWQVAGFLR